MSVRIVIFCVSIQRDVLSGPESVQTTIGTLEISLMENTYLTSTSSVSSMSTHFAIRTSRVFRSLLRTKISRQIRNHLVLDVPASSLQICRPTLSRSRLRARQCVWRRSCFLQEMESEWKSRFRRSWTQSSSIRLTV